MRQEEWKKQERELTSENSKLQHQIHELLHFKQDASSQLDEINEHMNLLRLNNQQLQE